MRVFVSEYLHLRPKNNTEHKEHIRWDDELVRHLYSSPILPTNRFSRRLSMRLRSYEYHLSDDVDRSLLKLSIYSVASDVSYLSV